MSALQTIEVDAIVPSPFNQRRVTDKDPAVLELAASIKAVGLLQPVTVRPNAASDKKAHSYELVCGERRWRASRVAGKKTIEVIVRPLDDQAAREACVTENMQREDLTPIEEARGVRTLLDGGWDVARVADRLGKSTSWVARRAALTNLVDAVRAAYEKPDGPLSRWTAAHLELVARLPVAAQEAWWKHQDRDPVYTSEISVEELRMDLENESRDLKKVPWDVRDTTLAGCRECAGCMARTSAQTELFDDVPKKEDRCLDASCYDKKMKAWRAARVAEYRQKHEGLVVLEKHSWDWTDAKKGEKGAVPVLRFAGSTMKLEWMKKRPGATAAAAPKDPEKERREKLKEQRERHVGISVSKAMRALKKRPSTLAALQVIDLATQNPYGALKLNDKLTVEGMAEREWPIVRDRLAQRAAFDEKLKALVVRLLALDEKALEAAALAAHPDPKPKAVKTAAKKPGKKKGGRK